MGQLLMVLPFWLLSVFVRFYLFVNMALDGHLRSGTFCQNTCCVFTPFRCELGVCKKSCNGTDRNRVLTAPAPRHPVHVGPA